MGGEREREREKEGKLASVECDLPFSSCFGAFESKVLTSFSSNTYEHANGVFFYYWFRVRLWCVVPGLHTIYMMIILQLSAVAAPIPPSFSCHPHYTTLHYTTPHYTQGQASVVSLFIISAKVKGGYSHNTRHIGGKRNAIKVPYARSNRDNIHN